MQKRMTSELAGHVKYLKATTSMTPYQIADRVRVNPEETLEVLEGKRFDKVPVPKSLYVNGELLEPAPADIEVVEVRPSPMPAVLTNTAKPPAKKGFAGFMLADYVQVDYLPGEGFSLCGRRVTLNQNWKKHGSKVDMETVKRRIGMGWTLDEAVNIGPMPGQQAALEEKLEEYRDWRKRMDYEEIVIGLEAFKAQMEMPLAHEHANDGKGGLLPGTYRKPAGGANGSFVPAPKAVPIPPPPAPPPSPATTAIPPRPAPEPKVEPPPERSVNLRLGQIDDELRMMRKEQEGGLSNLHADVSALHDEMLGIKDVMEELLKEWRGGK